MLGLAGSFSYTSRVSFSEESLLHSPCCFQWAVLGTMMFNHACMRHVSSSERQRHTERQTHRERETGRDRDRDRDSDTQIETDRMQKKSKTEVIVVVYFV